MSVQEPLPAATYGMRCVPEKMITATTLAFFWWLPLAGAFFTSDYSRRQTPTPNNRHKSHYPSPTSIDLSSLDDVGSNSESGNRLQNAMSSEVSYSTLTLLEHIHLLTPNAHQTGARDGSVGIIDLFANSMGFGIDPRSVKNVNNQSGN